MMKRCAALRLSQLPGRARCSSRVCVPHRLLCYRPSAVRYFAMKPGTPIPGLDIYKDRDPPVALERSEYPAWIDNLAKKDKSLAELRRMPEEEATDKDKMRYLKLTRRMKIKKNNEEASARR